MMENAESLRLEQDRLGQKSWRRFGAYLSERQWGTVREDYSGEGAAWDYFPHDHARSRAYRWGEDGLAGFCDDQQRLCLSLALWNGRDPILKERLFGLAGPEGNHAEDCKEQYYYLDATPTHSYLKMLYKYPQAAFPYAALVDENRRRGKDEPEYELLDTGVFDQDRYFDVFVEYAKADTEDVLVRVTAHNRGPERAPLHIIPQVFFRNTWSWGDAVEKPAIGSDGANSLTIEHPTLGRMYLRHEGDADVLFTENETNRQRLWGQPNNGPVKDAFGACLIEGRPDAVAKDSKGTKAGLVYRFDIDAGGSATVRYRLSRTKQRVAFRSFDETFNARLAEADAFYDTIHDPGMSADQRLVQRQALAGMVWSQQFFNWDVPRWLKGDPGQPSPPASRLHGRNREWPHVNHAEVISMPDKWEYPWYAAWDLAFHCVPLAMIDPEFAKQQLVLLTREWYMHPSGQLPAYEWALGDVNPPVHAWATWRVYEMERERTGRGDRAFLERVFQKLLLNFTWWVNRKDAEGRNIFQGGFLGLDNIGVFDRSAPLPTGGHISQCDGTSWMAMYSLNLMRIALELARENPVYQDMATKFFEHFLYIAAAMNNVGGSGMSLWCDTDEFYYDVLNLPGGKAVPLKLRTMVGLIPLFAVQVLDGELLERVPEFRDRLEWFLNYRPDLACLVSRWNEPGKGETHLLSLLRGHRMKCLLRRMLDEKEFLSPYGVRALSAAYRDQPYNLSLNGFSASVRYQPAESDSGLFGGNSNWRGPIWMPVNYLIVESLRTFHQYYGEDFVVECPTGSADYLGIHQIADELARRLCALFVVNGHGVRPVLGYHDKLQRDPHFRDFVLFHEYFHGDNGRGVGASHQTGWTGLVATLLHELHAASPAGSARYTEPAQV